MRKMASGWQRLVLNKKSKTGKRMGLNLIEVALTRLQAFSHDSSLCLC